MKYSCCPIRINYFVFTLFKQSALSWRREFAMCQKPNNSCKEHFVAFVVTFYHFHTIVA